MLRHGARKAPGHPPQQTCRRTPSLTVVPATVSALAASRAFAAGEAVIGLISKRETIPFFVKMTAGAEAAAKAEGAKLPSGAGKSDGDNAGQLTAMDNMIAAGAKSILITSSNSKAIVPAIKTARDKSAMGIALDSPSDPVAATGALFATDNDNAGERIGQYAKATPAGKPAKTVTLDLFPGHPVGAQRHNGLLKGFGLAAPDVKRTELGPTPIGQRGPVIALLMAWVFFATQTDRVLIGANLSLARQPVMAVGG